MKSYASVPDLRCSDGLRVYNVPFLCAEEGKKKKRKEEDDDDLNEPTLIDGSLGLRANVFRCVCRYACVRALSFKCTVVLYRLNHFNRALMPEELSGRGHSAKMAP